MIAFASCEARWEKREREGERAQGFVYTAGPKGEKEGGEFLGAKWSRVRSMRGEASAAFYALPPPPLHFSHPPQPTDSLRFCASCSPLSTHTRKHERMKESERRGGSRQNFARMISASKTALKVVFFSFAAFSSLFEPNYNSGIKWWVGLFLVPSRCP